MADRTLAHLGLAPAAEEDAAPEKSSADEPARILSLQAARRASRRAAA
jgi:hypothetical protein